MAKSGRETIIGVTKGSAWGTAIALAAKKQILPFSVDPIILDGELVFDDTVGNWQELQEADLVKHLANPTITIPVRRTGAHFLFWAHIIGDDTETGTTPAITHTMSWQRAVTLFFTMALEINETASPGDIIEWPSLKVVGVTLEPDGDGFMQFVVSTMGDTIDIAGDATNSDTEFDLLSAVSEVTRMSFREVAFKMDEVGTDPVSGSIIGISNMSLVVNRPYPGEDVARGTFAKAPMTDEPIQDGAAEITFGFDVNDFTTIALLNDLETGQEYAADLNFDATVAAIVYKFDTELTNLRPIPAKMALDRGARIPLTRNFRAVMVDQVGGTPNTGMTTVEPIHTIIQDDNDLSYEDG